MTSSRTSYDRPAACGQVDAFATSTATHAAAATGVSVSGGANLPAGQLALTGADAAGRYSRSEVLADAAILPASVAVTASRADAATDPTTLLRKLTDVVRISKAEYNAETGLLTVMATSSDASPNLVLTVAAVAGAGRTDRDEVCSATGPMPGSNSQKGLSLGQLLGQVKESRRMKSSSDLLSVDRHPAGGEARTLSPTRCDMVEAGGRFWQMLGLPRSTGQIYGLLYISSHPLSLDDIVSDLGISKASASTGTRQLVAWGVIKQVWIPGERRDYFEVVPDLSQLLRIIYQEQIKRRLEGARMRLSTRSRSIPAV